MNGILLVSKKVYSLAKGKAVTEWIEKSYAIKGLTEPRDFELRFVNANVNMENLEQKFPEFDLSWNQQSDIRIEANKMCLSENGRTDIVWYSKKLHVALIIESHVRMNSIVNYESLDALKNMFG